jgi:hypothetical protein
MSGSAPLIMGSWVFEDTLKPFVEMVAFYAHCTLDDNDWTAIEYGVKDSDADKDKWFRYYLEGPELLYLELAINPGSDVVSVVARGNEALARELEVLFYVCQSYRLSPLG